jgi:type II secretory ATPase GspE/PulE/Tfp pilus assembly ATPase PilB-like protein
MTTATQDSSSQSHAPTFDVSKLTVENAVAKLIDHANTLSASDLFIAADEDKTVISVRALGLVRPISITTADLGRRYVAYLKANAGMEISEKRRPIDGRWIYRDSDQEATDLRINIIPTVHGEDVAIRLLPRARKLYKLDSVGLADEQYRLVSGMVDSLGGLVLITGPTGSGKTATLYACLQRLNDGQRKINTIEDPVEYTLPGLRQSQVNPSIELGFSELLRSVLRQSPDVIMIGEIRDTETAATAVHAANSGQLVFATLHSGQAAGAIQAMRSLGVQSNFLATSLRGVIAQRLVRTLCPNCKTSFELDEALGTFEEVKGWLKADEGKRLFAPGSCEMCNQIGYAGRAGLFEVINITPSIRNLIADGRPAGEIRNHAIGEKMITLRQAALLKVARGQTSTEEIFRVIPSEHLMLED